MRILVTGAGGFVGGYLLRLLVEHRHEVAAMGIGGGAFLKEMGVPSHEVDILDVAAVKSCMEDFRPDAVIHLAAISNVPLSWEKPGLTVDVNIRGTVNVLQALHGINPKAKFLSIGSSDEYGLAAKSGIPLTEEAACQPQNPYSVSKYAAEQMILQLGKKYGMTVLPTRSFNHFGPGQAKGFVTTDFASQIAAIERGEQEPVLCVGDLTASRDFTFVADVVEAYVALVEKDVPEGVYNICSGKARTMQEILDELLSFSTVQISVKKDEARMRPSEVPFFVGDYGKLKKATGWAPRYDFHQGMKETLDYWRNH